MKTEQRVPQSLILAATCKLAGDAKKTRDQLLPGDYEDEVLVRLRFKLKVGQDYDMSRKVRTSPDQPPVPWERLALHALDKLNDVTVESLLTKLLAEDFDESSLADVKDRTATAMGRVRPLAEPVFETQVTRCKGKVTGACFMDMVEV